MDSEATSRSSKQFRKELLVFDTTDKSWQPPIKKFLVSSKKYSKISVESIDVCEQNCFVLFKGISETKEEVSYIDQISLDCLNLTGIKPSTSFLSNIPNWFNSRLSFCSDLRSSLYVCGGSGFARFNLDSQTWDKLQKPIGDLGEEKPLLAGHPSLIYLLTGKQKHGDTAITNHIQVSQLTVSQMCLL